MSYACVAKDSSGGRCQTAVETEGESFCTQHLECESVEPAPEPTNVLIRFHGGNALYKALKKTGILSKPRNQFLLDEKNRQEALRLRSDNAYWFNHYATGIQIFRDTGVQDVTGVADVVDEMHAAGYRVHDIHWLKEERKPRGRQAYDAATLVVGFAKSDVTVPDEFALLLEIFDMLKKDRWGIAKVFANPPQESGEVVHSLELYQRGFGDATSILHFLDGLWGIELRERSPVYSDHHGPLTQRLGDLMQK